MNKEEVEKWINIYNNQISDRNFRLFEYGYRSGIIDAINLLTDMLICDNNKYIHKENIKLISNIVRNKLLKQSEARKKKHDEI